MYIRGRMIPIVDIRMFAVPEIGRQVSLSNDGVIFVKVENGTKETMVRASDLYGSEREAWDRMVNAILPDLGTAIKKSMISKKEFMRRLSLWL